VIAPSAFIRLRRLAAGMLLGAILALAMSACGKRGEPAAPDPSQNTYPRVYPRA
jgi:hypothetical protein